MKQFKPKACLIFLWMVLLSLFCIRSSWATQPNVSFNEETLVSESELSSQSGQGLNESTIRSNAQLNNNVINVSPGGSVTNGDNFVGDQAFTGVNGITSVVQNSGNNVIIQNSTIVNVSFQ